MGLMCLILRRKTTLLLNNVLAISGAILVLFSKTALSFEMIMVARVLYGINAGMLEKSFFIVIIIKWHFSVSPM